MRAVQLQRIDNVRDLGGIPVCGGRMVKPGVLYRGSAPYGMSDSDRTELFERRGIACIIDVRCGWERTAKPTPQIPGVEMHHIPFYDKDIVGIEYTEPAAGTKVVGRDVACDPLRFYHSLSNELTARQMREALACIFEYMAAEKPVYYHCSGGKDRAGILTFLILYVLGASREDILEDYLATNISRDAKYESVFARFLKLADGDEQRARELTESHRARPENLMAFYEGITERYGSLDEFIEEQLGIGSSVREAFRAVCTIELNGTQKASTHALITNAVSEVETLRSYELHEIVR